MRPLDVPPYEADIWDLRITRPQGPSGDSKRIHWTKTPKPWREELRLAAWRLINVGVSTDFVLAHGLATRERLTYSMNYSTVLHWNRFAKWATNRRIHSLSETTSDDFVHYYNEEFLAKNAGHGVTKNALFAISRLWNLSEISGTPPPWLGAENLADYLPSRPRYNENLTSIIPENVISKLLGWSESMIQDLSTDLLDAKQERDRIYRYAKIVGSRRAPNEDVRIIEPYRESCRRFVGGVVG